MLLCYHMRQCKKAKQDSNAHAQFNDLLVNMQHAARANVRLHIAYCLDRVTGHVAKVMKGHLKNCKSKNNGSSTCGKTLLPLSWFQAVAYDRKASKSFDLNPVHSQALHCIPAIATVMLQAKLLCKIALMVKNRRADTGVLRRKFDEASHQYKVKIIKAPEPRKALARQELKHLSSKWSVMVCKVKLVIAWPHGTTAELSLALPPTIMHGKKAEDQHNQLCFHPVFAVMRQAIHHISINCKVWLDLSLADSAPSNERMIHGWLNKWDLQYTEILRARSSSPASLEAEAHTYTYTLCDWTRCFNHQTFLINTKCLAVMRSPLLSTAFCMRQFLETGHYWMRLYLGWNQWCHDVVPKGIFTCDVAPPRSKAVDEFIDYMSTWSSHGTLLKSRLQQYFDLTPTSLRGRPQHPENGCCCNAAETVRKFQTLGRACHFSMKLPCPSTNKWTAQWRSFDFLFAGATCHEYLSTVWDLAFSKVQFSEGDEERAAVTGQACRNTHAALRDEQFRFEVQVFCISTEAVRVMTIWFLAMLKRQRDRNASAQQHSRGRASTGHADLHNPSFSIVVAYHQYLSGLIYSTGEGRLRLLWDTFPSWTDWLCANLPNGNVRVLRHMILLTDASGIQRYDDEILCPFGSLAVSVLGDRRSNPSVVERQQVVGELWDTLRPCCLRPGIGYQLCRQGVTSFELRSESHWTSLWRILDMVVDYTIADVECCNSFMKSNAPENTTFGQVAAKLINKFAKERYENAQHEGVDLSGDNSLCELKKQYMDALKASRHWHQSAVHAFIQDFNVMHHDEHDMKFSTNRWPVIKEVFSNLPLERKNHYEMVAVNSRRIAKLNRALASNLEERVKSRAKAVASSLAVASDIDHVNLSAIRTTREVLDLPADPDEMSVHLRSNCLVSTSKMPLFRHGLRHVEKRSKKFGEQVDALDTCPMPEEELQQVFKDMHDHRQTMVDVVRRFSTSAQQTCIPPTEHKDSFPSSVHYKSVCGPVCREKSSAARYNLHKALVGLLHTILHDYSKVIDFARENVLVLVQLEYRVDVGFGGLQSSELVNFFSLIAAPCAQWSIHKQTQVHYILDVLSGDADDLLEGVVLSLRRLPATEFLTAFQEPFIQSALQGGPLAGLKSVDYAAYMVDGFVRGKPSFSFQQDFLFHDIQKVHLKILDYDDVSLSAVSIKGVTKARHVELSSLFTVPTCLAPAPKPGPKPAPRQQKQNSFLGIDVSDLGGKQFGTHTSGADQSDDVRAGVHALMSEHPTSLEELVEFDGNSGDPDCALQELGFPLQDGSPDPGYETIVSMVRADAKAENERSAIVIDLDADNDIEQSQPSKLERANDDQYCKTTGLKRRKQQVATAKQTDETQTQTDIESGPTIVKLFQLISAAEEDRVVVKHVRARWPTYHVLTSGSSSSSGPAISQEKLGEVAETERTDGKISVRAQCHVHRQCVCWVTVQASQYSLDGVKDILNSWLGLARALPHNYHEFHSIIIRENFGMKPRL